jgi:hypothetical protein
MLERGRAIVLQLAKDRFSLALYICVIKLIDPRIMLGIISRSPPRLIQARSIAYAVARSSNGELPVYTDIRTGRTRYLVIVKNVSGDINVRWLPPDLVSRLLLTFLAQTGLSERAVGDTIPARLTGAITAIHIHLSRQTFDPDRRQMETRRQRLAQTKGILITPGSLSHSHIKSIHRIFVHTVSSSVLNITPTRISVFCPVTRLIIYSESLSHPFTWPD